MTRLLLVPALAFATMGCGGEEDVGVFQQELKGEISHIAIHSGGSLVERHGVTMDLSQARAGSDIHPFIVCLPDKDEDGFGDVQGKPVGVMGMQCPAGHVATGGDCADSDARAYPGQTDYFDTPVKGPGGGWDFNCDGVVQAKHTDLALDCESQPDEVLCYQWSDLSAPHWVQTVPDCGKKGLLAAGFGCSWDGSSCSTNLIQGPLGQRVQPCR